MARRPGAVLFACSANRVRSPMAEALMKLFYGREIYVDSCGLKPSDAADPFVEAALDELGAQLGDHKAKGFEDLEPDAFDLIVTMTPDAHHRALEATRGASVDVEYWPVADPTLATGSREQVMDAYRAARDQLAARIVERFGHPQTAGG